MIFLKNYFKFAEVEQKFGCFRAVLNSQNVIKPLSSDKVLFCSSYPALMFNKYSSMI